MAPSRPPEQRSPLPPAWTPAQLESARLRWQRYASEPFKDLLDAPPVNQQ